MFRRPGKNSIPYLVGLSDNAASLHDIADIRAAIESKGFWHSCDEWRISTFTAKRIEPEEFQGHRGYRVRASCGHEFSCYAPTLERAVEFLGIYDRLIMDLFWSVGWPSWAAADKLEP